MECISLLCLFILNKDYYKKIRFLDCFKRPPVICDLFLKVPLKVTYDSLDCTLKIFLHPNRCGKEHIDLHFFARLCVCPSVCAFSISPTILLFVYES